MLKKRVKKQVIEYEDFGSININLDKIMSERKISTYELSSKADVKFQTIKNLREDKTCRISLEVLAKICYVLECKVEDILEFYYK